MKTRQDRLQYQRERMRLLRTGATELKPKPEPKTREQRLEQQRERMRELRASRRQPAEPQQETELVACECCGKLSSLKTCGTCHKTRLVFGGCSHA